MLSFNEFPVTTGSNPIGIAASDNTLYYTEQTLNKIGIMDTNGQVLNEFPVPTSNSRPEFIVHGPDGNMWFTEQFASKIASISPSGTVVEYPTLTPGAFPTMITAGPDGNIWFTEFMAHKVAMIDLAGHTFQIAEFSTPTEFSRPFGITAGPDGNIWFTENSASANNVGMLDVAGGTNNITEFPIPASSSGPLGIAAGPDGNIWFVESNSPANHVAMLDLAGGTHMITEFPIPSANSSSQLIVAGPDGNMWFTEQEANNLASVDLVGGTNTITEYGIPTPTGRPIGLTLGPSGNDLWFAEVNPSQIGQLVFPLVADRPAGRRMLRSADNAGTHSIVPAGSLGTLFDPGLAQVPEIRVRAMPSAGASSLPLLLATASPTDDRPFADRRLRTASDIAEQLLAITHFRHDAGNWANDEHWDWSRLDLNMTSTGYCMSFDCLTLRLVR